MPTKATIIGALDRFIHQRPGLEFGNYGDVQAYRAEVRRIGQQLQDARTLLRAVELRAISAEAILEASQHAFSGRLTIKTTDDQVTLDYCTGQYWPTEYRAAACAVLASCLWTYWRTKSTTAADIRRIATREFGRGIAQRWFR